MISRTLTPHTRVQVKDIYVKGASTATNSSLLFVYETEGMLMFKILNREKDEDGPVCVPYTGKGLALPGIRDNKLQKETPRRWGVNNNKDLLMCERSDGCCNKDIPRV